MPSDIRLAESGAMGRVAYARIAPNEDLVQGIAKLCVAEGFRHAFVRGALGSLVDACLATAESPETSKLTAVPRQATRDCINAASK